MQEISTLPGRVRYRIGSLYYNKPLARYINVYTDNLLGVKYCSVNHNTASILVMFDPERTSCAAIGKNIKNAVISALKNKPANIREYDEYYALLEKRDRAKRNIFAFGLIYLGLRLKNSIWGKFALSANAAFLQAAAAVTVIGGYPLLKGIYKRFAKKIPSDPDILLSLAALAFTITRESSKGVLLLMLKAMNDYIKYSADAESRRLLNQSINRMSGTAWLVSASGQEVLVGIGSLKPDDLIAVHEGEVIAVKGKVEEGAALVDTLYYSGQPVVSNISAGGMVNDGMSVLSGELKVKVHGLPESAERGRAEKGGLLIEQKVKKYQSAVTPLSLTAGSAAFLISGNFMNALAVLLALTPSGAATALSTGMKSYISLLNKHKIFLRRPEVFEKVTGVNHIVFDKTGTLTYGRMRLELLESYDRGYSGEELLKICAACESDHYHPISLTLQEENGNSLDTGNVRSSVLIPSRGVRAVYNSHDILIGNRLMMNENGISMGNAEKAYADCEKRLLIPVAVSIDGRLTGLLAFSDTLRKGSYELVERLMQKHGLKISLITGDSGQKAGEIAGKLHINDVYGNCSQEDKARIIRGFKKSGRVMMVGDGLNDIDAMKEADISVSFASSSADRVKLNSDCILFEDHMVRLADMVSLSQRAYRRIDQSIVFSKLYNMFFGVLAFTGAIDAFAAKSVNTVNSLLVLLLNKRIEYLGNKN